MPGEVFFVRCVRVALLAAIIAIQYQLVYFTVKVECPLTSYSGGVKWAAFLAIITLFFYTRIDWLYAGLLKARISRVRLVAAALAVLIAIPVVVSLSQNSGCQSVISGLILPTGLMVFYSAFFLAVLAGDAYLGVIRSIIRAKVKPAKFSQLGESKQAVDPRRKRKRFR